MFLFTFESFAVYELPISINVENHHITLII